VDVASLIGSRYHHAMRRLPIAVAGALMAAACGDRAATSGAGGETGGTMVIASPGLGTPQMFPAFAQDQSSRLIADNVFEHLAEIGNDLNTLGDRGFEPRLARSWEWSRDSMSIAFAIDPRAKWHDGQPVRASDVRYSFALLKNPKTGSHLTSLMSDIDSASVRDSLTAVVWFHRRSPEQFYTAVYQTWIFPEHLLKDIAPEALMTSPAVAKPVGSGRFRIASVDPNVRVELIADTTHYRGRPKLDRVIVAMVADAGAALTQLLSGQLDWIDFVPPAAHGRVDSNATTKLVEYPALQYVFMGMNARDQRNPRAPHPVLGDVRVRRAISMALDRQAMLANVYGDRGKIGVGPYPRALADTTLKPPPFDRGHAAALLDSAGWVAGADGMRVKSGRPLAFRLAVPSSSAPRVRYAVMIQEQLKAVGAKVDIDQMDFGAHQNAGETGRFDASLMAWASDPSPSDLRQSWTVSGFPPAGQNAVRYSNPAIDAIADSILTARDPARVQQLRHRATETIINDAPAVWLYDILTIGGAHERLQPGPMRADGWWADLAEWWIPANARIERDRIGLAARP
jgi:peptide/nickel transport system substrate-binding protein